MMKSNELERIFGARGWLSHQPAAFQSAFIAMGRQVALDRAAPVFHMGDSEGGVYGIVSGSIAVMGGTRWQFPALAHVARAGDWFGHRPALLGGARTLSMHAMEQTTLLLVPLERLRSRMRSEPDFATRMAQMAEIGTETVISVARDLLIRNSARRLAAVLLRVTAMGQVQPDDREGYAITQAELAEMANMSRHQANRTLGAWKRAGLIDLGYNRIRLLNVPALRELAYAEN